MTAPTVHAALDDTTPEEGALMRLTVDYGDPDDMKVVHSEAITDNGVSCRVQHDPVEVFVADSDASTTWTEVSDNGARAVFTAAAKKDGTVTVKATDTLGANTTTDTVTYNVNEPTQPPEPEPTTGHGMIGMSAPVGVWDARKKEVEATGGRLQCRRLFFQSLSDSTNNIVTALGEGLHPVCSWKVGSNWASVASGGSDSALDTLGTRLGNLKKPVSVAFHHEPDEKSTPADVGEGGSAADFARMQQRIIDRIKPKAPLVKFSVIMNGWWWTSAKGKLTDAQIAVWLPPSLRKNLDIIGADDYSPQGGEPAAVKTKNRVAWAKRMGDVKALGIGETNGFKDGDLEDVFALVKGEDLFDNGWALVWNSTGTSYLPLTQTGLLDNFQRILVGWPK